MSPHSLKRLQILPITIQQAWDFFSSPLNLNVITPPEMNFRILSPFKSGDQIFEGMLIDYSVSPLFRIPLQWQTEITKVEPLKYFIDEQKKGPFASWHHGHYFKEVDDGVEMMDLVQWNVPFGFFGDAVNTLLVRKKVVQIFEFRAKKLTTQFG